MLFSYIQLQVIHFIYYIFTIFILISLNKFTINMEHNFQKYKFKMIIKILPLLSFYLKQAKIVLNLEYIFQHVIYLFVNIKKYI